MKTAFILSLLFSFNAYGKVTKLLKKRRIVVINDGNVKKGERVCFYSGSKKKACGKVVKAKNKKSYVRVKSKTRFRRIKKGMSHEVVGADGKKKKSSASGEQRVFFRLLYLPSIFNKSTYDQLVFKDEPDAKGKQQGFAKPSDETINTSDEEAKFSEKMAMYFTGIGGGLEVEAKVFKDISVLAGGRFAWLPPQNRATGSKLITVENGQELVVVGVYNPIMEITGWLDFYLYEVPNIGLRLGLGGEFTQSRISAKANTESPKTSSDFGGKKVEELLTYTSVANIISGRVGFRKDFALGKFGFGLGLNAVISPVSLGNNISIDTFKQNLKAKYTPRGDAKKVLQKELKDNLNHENNMFSVVASLSVYFGI